MVMNTENPRAGKTAALQKRETRVKLVRRVRRKRRDMKKKLQVSNKNHNHHHHHHHEDANNYGDEEENHGDGDSDEEENDDGDEKEEEVEKKVMALKRIVPGGESLVGIEKLFEETAGYIMELQCQVQAMKVLATFFEGLEKENMKLGG